MARVFLLLLLGCWSAVGALSDSPSPGFPAPAQVYSSQEQAGGGTAVLAPNAAVQQGAAPLGPALGRVPQPEGCSAACRSQPACAWFEYCQAPVSGQSSSSGSWPESLASTHCLPLPPLLGSVKVAHSHAGSSATASCCTDCCMCAACLLLCLLQV